MTEYIWFLDPGLTTGWSRWKDATLVAWGTFQPDEVRRFFLNEVKPYLNICNKNTFLYEKLTVRQLSFNPIGFEVVGALKYIAQIEGFDVKYQEPSQIQGVMKWPIYNFKGHKLSEHEKDSIAHGIVYYKKLRQDVYLPEKFIVI